jgi:hypothetical protein
MRIGLSKVFDMVVILKMYDRCQCPLMELCVGLSEKKLDIDRPCQIFNFLYLCESGYCFCQYF